MTELTELSAKATQGVWSFDGNCGGYIADSDYRIVRAYSVSDAVYIPALVNAHRTGMLIEVQTHVECVGCEGNPAPENTPCAVCGKRRLIEVPEDAVERMARAIQAVMPEWLHGAVHDADLATAALRALTGEK
jgi:hypothetical protein